MNIKELRNLFDQLTECEKKQHLSQARELLKTILNVLLTGAYSIVRGQAPPRILRGLMEMEIEIGGDDGDFKMFNNRQLIDLFNRGKVVDNIQNSLEGGCFLAAAMDLTAIQHWLEMPDASLGNTHLSAIAFIHRWLRLFAEEIGLMDFAEASEARDASSAEPTTDKNGSSLQPGKPFTEPVTGMTFVFIPGGTFSMGDTFGDGIQDEQPVHEVSLSPFYMAIYPVTQAQWKRLMDENPSASAGDRQPVEQVSFNDAMIFIDRLNAASLKGIKFDLPSEAQWEYAARSGGLNELHAGGSDPESVAWFENNSDGGPAPVGTRLPNGLGLYDMSGNVWEWCRDIYVASAYRQHAKVDPVCTTRGRDRVIRGGGWHLDAWSARCSRRLAFDPELFGPALGVRLVMKTTV
jgi:formylglycine-generating enzyme required for sulfatase activity